MIAESDLTIGLKFKHMKSDCLAAVDVQMSDFYGLSYLMYKHGTLY
jgi:hypothetical protein